MYHQVLPLTEDAESKSSEDPLYTMDEIRIEVMRSRGAGGQVRCLITRYYTHYDLFLSARQQNGIRCTTDTHTYWHYGLYARRAEPTSSKFVDSFVLSHIVH